MLNHRRIASFFVHINNKNTVRHNRLTVTPNKITAKDNK